MKIVILENDKADFDRLCALILAYGRQSGHPIEIIGESSAERFFQSGLCREISKIGAFFLDIQLGGISGMEAAKRLRKQGYQGDIVFLTAFREYVFQGYEVHALNYLLKPVEKTGLFRTLDEICAEMSANVYCCRNKNGILSIPYADILTFSSRLHYVDILMTNGECCEQIASLAKISAKLPPEFIRVHRSYIVNMRHIYKMTPGMIELSNHLMVKISRSCYQDAVRAFSAFTARFDES